MHDYENDEPIQYKNQDILDRSNRAKGLAKYIRHKFDKKDIESPKKLSGSYNIAIIGRWGEGKTSFVNLTKEQLKDFKDIEIIEFDPWYFPSKCNIHEQFFSLINNRKNPILHWLGFYLLILLVINFDVFDPIFKWMINIELLNSILNFISRFIKDFKSTYPVLFLIIGVNYILYPYNINSLLNKIKYLLPGNDLNLKWMLDGKHQFDPIKAKEKLKKLTDGRKLLVIIDNIDRLYSYQIKRVLDLVKGMGDLPNIIYILAFDKQIVLKALNQKHGKQDSKYLDKFIQYQILLHTSYEQQVINTITKELNDTEAIYYSKELSQYITNIRELKRLINTLKQNYESLQDNVILYQLLFITAIGLQNHEIYYLISRSKEILCLKNIKDEESINKVKELHKELKSFRPSTVLFDIITFLFPIILYSRDTIEYFRDSKIKHIDHYDYFDIYFKISFPDDLVSDENLNSLIAQADDKDKLSKGLLELLSPSIEEEKQKIPNRIVNPFKWLDNLTARILELNEFSNAPNWLLSLAKVTEEYADYVEDNQPQVPRFHDFLDKLAQLLQERDPAEDNHTPPIYAFLRIYLKETNPSREGNKINADRILKLKDVVINNIKKYSENNDISQLSFFTQIIRFATREKLKEIINIIKVTIDNNDALLKLIKYFNQTTTIQSLTLYIPYEEAITKIKSIGSDEAGDHDIKLYIELLSQQNA